MIGIFLGLTLSKGGGFSLAAFMAAQSDGLWYDFTKTDRLFQENVGPTPVAVANDVIGLALSQRLWGGKTLAAYLASQPELKGRGTPVLAGTATAATYNTSTGDGTVTRVDFNNQSGVAFSGLSPGRTYAIDITGPTGLIFRDGAIVIGSLVASLSATGRATYFIQTGTSSTGLCIAATASGGTQTFTVHSFKEVSRYPASQATTSFKPKFQTAGCTFDGADDRLLTGYAAGSGDNFVMLPTTTVPASIASTQVLAGALDGASNGAYVAITTAGALRVKLGSTTLDSTGVDLRNGVHDIGWWTDGATLYLYADGAIVGSGAWSGTTPATTWNLGALNNNGTPSNFFGGSLMNALAGRQSLSLTLANQIAQAA